MKNKEIADLFEKMADILEFKGENPFKISAYRKASRIIQPFGGFRVYVKQKG